MHLEATGERPDVAVLEVGVLYRPEPIPEPGLAPPKNAQGVVAVVAVEQATMALVVLGEILFAPLLGLRLIIVRHQQHAQTK